MKCLLPRSTRQSAPSAAPVGLRKTLTRKDDDVPKWCCTGGQDAGLDGPPSLAVPSDCPSLPDWPCVARRDGATFLGDHPCFSPNRSIDCCHPWALCCCSGVLGGPGCPDDDAGASADRLGKDAAPVIDGAAEVERARCAPGGPLP